MTAPAVLPHRDAVWALLQTETRMRWYEGEVPTTPPLDPDGRMHAYGVFWPGAGKADVLSLCGTSDGMDWRFGVTVYAGDVARVLLARDWVCGLIVDASPTVAGRNVGLIRMDYGGHDLPIRVDNPMPPRFGLPLLFTLGTSPA